MADDLPEGVPETIPLHVLEDRDELGLTINEAIAYWLCDDPDGPQVTQQAAAETLSTSQGSVWNLLDNARRKHQR